MPNGIRELPGTSSVHSGITVNTPYEKEDQGVKVEDFLQLMIAQLTNQDFMNPADDTQYVTQLAQFATMQSMQELSYYSQTNYVTNLVGKTVTVATLGLGGAVSKDVGVVSAINLSGESYTLTVNGKEYEMSQIMNVADTNYKPDESVIEDVQSILPLVTDKSPKNIEISWAVPNEEAAKEEGIRYDVYYTADGQLDLTNLANVRKGTKVIEGTSSNQINITELEPDTTYFISVVAHNKNGDYALYKTLTQNTRS
jgi:flagellar hook assembly protein FlgD